MSYVMGIDVGTSSLKVLIYDSEKCVILATSSVPLTISQNSDGTAEQSTAWWVQGLHRALSGIKRSILNEVKSIGVAAQQHGFVPLGKNGEVLSRVKLWCDTSTKKETDDINHVLGGARRVIQIAGNPILPGYTASKILWFKRNREDSYAKLKTIFLPHDYLNFYLTGERSMEYGDASGTGFLDVRNRVWSKEILSAIDPDRDLSECLPPIKQHDEIAGTLREVRAEELGLRAGIPVTVGGGDNMMAAMGTGNVESGDVTMSLGTSGTLYAYSDQPVVDPDGNLAAFCSSTGGWLPLICTMGCTVGAEISRSLLEIGIDEFEHQVSTAPIGSGGLTLLPFYNGERTPNMPAAKGCLFGVDSINFTRENFLRASIEGATFSMKNGLDIFRKNGIVPDNIILTGGGANSETWSQLVADVCQVQVTKMEQDEGAAFGAALQAITALDGVDNDYKCIKDEHITRNQARRILVPSRFVSDSYEEHYVHYQRAVETAQHMYAE